MRHLDQAGIEQRSAGCQAMIVKIRQKKFQDPLDRQGIGHRPVGVLELDVEMTANGPKRVRREFEKFP